MAERKIGEVFIEPYSKLKLICVKDKYNENIVDNKNNDNESPNNNFIEDYKKYRYTRIFKR